MYIQNIEALSQSLIDMQTDSEIQGLLLFGGDLNKPSTDAISSVLKNNHKPLMGGFFPEIMADGERKKEGFVLVPLYESWEIMVFESSEEKSLETQMEHHIENLNLDIGSVFCFVNALWNQKTSMMQLLYDALGPFVNYLGGGAGSLSFQSFPCVFANQDVIEHGAVVGVMNKHLSLGVAHGWHPISEPIKVTETNGNTIVSLNWKPAFSVYQDLVQTHAQQVINEDNFFDIAKSYPLGLVKLDDEMIIRDPYATSHGSLHIVDEVPMGEYIRIMHGNMDSLLEGAKNAVAQASIDSGEVQTQLCIDCISRVLFMQDDFKEELVFLNQNQLVNGVLSIGEIANPINAPLELFNKTVVVAQWKKKS